MDKYTVDLDQVLNDFEYSELTDQHSKNVSERPQSSIPFHPPPVTKHSINNVFHSLNEYLNSGINSGSGSTSFGETYLSENPASSYINDNKLDYNPQRLCNKPDELQNNINRNILGSLDDSFKNDPVAFKSGGHNAKDIAGDVNSSTFNVSASHQVENQANQQQIGSSFVEYQEPIHSENLETLPRQINKISGPFKQNNVDSIKTEISNLSLSKTDKPESELTPELSCTKSSIESESSNVNNGIECDRNAIYNVENVLSEGVVGSGGNEIYFEVSSVLENVPKETDVHSVEVNEENNDLTEGREDILVDIGEESFQSVDTQRKLENYVIEPSESPYAIEAGVIQEKNLYSELNEKTNSVTEDREDNMSDQDVHTTDKDVEVSNRVSETCENIVAIKELTDENLDESNNKNVYLTQPNNSSWISDSLLTIATDNAENYTEKCPAPQKIIGFSADIDIDETELNQMLEDLESEDSELEESVPEENFAKQNMEEHEGTTTDIVEKIAIEAKVEDNTGKDSNAEEDTHQTDLEIEHQTVSSNIKSDLSQQMMPDSTNVLEPVEKPAKQDCHPQILECLEIEKPNKTKKLLKTSTQSEQSSKESVTTIQRTQESIEKHTEEIERVVKTEELSPEKEQSRESLSRPQNLPLNNELKDDNVGRKINLIGSPGSTPYNNVYINKSIEPKTTQDTESDYTSSASPTFSDCSTESTSTASTVSVEDVPNNADKFTTKKTSGVKNTNVETEARELVRVDERTESVGETDNNNVQDISDDHLSSDNVENDANIPDETVANATLNNSEINPGNPQVHGSQSTETFLDKSWLGKEAPLWIPDGDAAACLHCDMKFTVLKRRHHCRACGLVLCSKCCNLKFKLEYLDAEARVCNRCYSILNKDTPNNAGSDHNSPESGNSPAFRPNPNNPLEYCSTVSPLQQAGQAGAPPPSVMVPVGVLKRKGSNKKSNKSVMFCDGIAPGSDLTNLDQDFNYNSDSKTPKSLQKVPEEAKKKEERAPPPAIVPTAKVSRNMPKVDQETGCFIPKSETNLPPTISINKTDILYSDCSNSPSVVEMLKNEALVFAINQNLFVHVKVISMSCCINKQAWCFCSEGLINVGSDEVVYLIEYIEEESFVPKDVFFHAYNVYLDAVKGTSIKELGLSLHNTSNFLDSRNHAGFVYIKPTFQCLENIIVPKEPYLIGILIHRWETPWAKLFPLRLILRLGAEYRYYPSPLISSRHRDSVFVEIGHTIINLLADFRNFTYTLPQIRGLIIHMEDKKTTITIPRNRYDQVMKSISNSSEHILAFAGNFSPAADSHLVCIQDTQGHENCYTTHAINIHNKPRKITGASFIVFNGSLKTSSGLTAKSNIVEDGLMIQIPAEHLDKIRDNLRSMKNHTIACGCINATSDETVTILWGENDVDFNVGVKSPVDLSEMKGVPSIRVHNGKDYFCNNGTRLIRWTEVFILQSGEENSKNQDPVDISKVSESIAKACCTALVKYLDLLVSNSFQKIGIRTTLHVENVSYSAGSNGLKLPPIYMRSLDNELIPVLHRITSSNLGDNAIVLELIFRILNA